MSQMATFPSEEPVTAISSVGDTAVLTTGYG